MRKNIITLVLIMVLTISILPLVSATPYINRGEAWDKKIIQVEEPFNIDLDLSSIKTQYNNHFRFLEMD